MSKVNITSQCLGTCGDYSVDIVNVPRSQYDDLEENQCSNYLVGKIKHLIELNPRGQIVKIN
jgi:hypothetical protein